MKEKIMHYANGRPAKNGDRIVVVHPDGKVLVGFLFGATPGNDYCNGKIAQLSEYHVNLKECLHWDDAQAVLGGGKLADVPDTSKPAAE